jgi:hypothetical protein
MYYTEAITPWRRGRPNWRPSVIRGSGKRRRMVALQRGKVLDQHPYTHVC